MNNEKILHLTLKKQWFDMIATGEKREEYREIKPYWEKRLCNHNEKGEFDGYKEFDFVIFRNGYQKNAPEMKVEVTGIGCDIGEEKWGARINTLYNVIELGNVVEIKNWKQ